MCVLSTSRILYKNGKHAHMSKIDKILHNLVNHTFEPELRNKVWEWLITPSKQKEKERALFSFWEEISTESTPDTYHSLKATQRKIKQQQSSKQLSLFPKLMRIAAILIIPILSVTASYLYIKNYYSEPEMIQCFVAEGSTQELTLPDGSKVNINSGSLLLYPKEFKGNIRSIYLVGEANFSVKKDKEHPFIVKTSHLKIEALGTKFNVQAYSGSEKIITTLENGAIKVDKADDLSNEKNSFILSPDEQLEYNLRTNLFEKRMIDAENYSGWTKGELNFINQSLKDMLTTLQREYAVQFIINPRLLTPDLYTIKFKQRDDINEIMNILTLTVGGLQYKTEDNIITIY